MLPKKYSKGVILQGQIQLEYVTYLQEKETHLTIQRGDLQGTRAIISDVQPFEDIHVEVDCPICGHLFLQVCDVCDYSKETSSENIYFLWHEL